MPRRVHRAAELGGRMPRPARVVEDAAGERDEVGVAGADDRLGLLEPVIRPTATTGMLTARFTSRASGTW